MILITTRVQRSNSDTLILLILKICGDEVGKVDMFNYLGYMLQKSSEYLEKNIKHRIKCEWIKWREHQVFRVISEFQ